MRKHETQVESFKFLERKISELVDAEMISQGSVVGRVDAVHIGQENSVTT